MFPPFTYHNLKTPVSNLRNPILSHFFVDFSEDVDIIRDCAEAPLNFSNIKGSNPYKWPEELQDFLTDM
jgi:hypothetical protein